MKANKSQIARLHILLNRTGKTAEKSRMIKEVTDNRTDSSKEMFQHEIERLIDGLQTLLNHIESKNNKMRRKILAMAHQMNWHLEENGELVLNKVTGEPVVDLKRVDAFCLTRGSFKKKLNQHNTKELAQLVTIFSKMFNQYLKK